MLGVGSVLAALAVNGNPCMGIVLCSAECTRRCCCRRGSERPDAGRRRERKARVGAFGSKRQGAARHGLENSVPPPAGGPYDGARGSSNGEDFVVGGKPHRLNFSLARQLQLEARVGLGRQDLHRRAPAAHHKHLEGVAWIRGGLRKSCTMATGRRGRGGGGRRQAEAQDRTSEAQKGSDTDG